MPFFIESELSKFYKENFNQFFFGRKITCEEFKAWLEAHNNRINAPNSNVDFSNDPLFVRFHQKDVLTLINLKILNSYIGFFWGCNSLTEKYNDLSGFLCLTKKTDTGYFEIIPDKPIFVGNSLIEDSPIKIDSLNIFLYNYKERIKELRKNTMSGFGDYEMTGIHHEINDFSINFFNNIPINGKINAVFVKDIVEKRSTVVYSNSSFNPRKIPPCVNLEEEVLYDAGNGCCPI